MKKFISRVQNLSQKAAELKAAMESAPAKVAELRETVVSTAGQFMQMRADVQSTVHGLRTDNEDRLIGALREVDAGTEVLRDAGYVVDDVEMELGVTQRVIVHLEKIDDVPHAILRQLMSAHQSSKTLHAILAALIKAEEMSDRVELAQLHYHKLTVYVGLAPAMRVCWCPKAPEISHAAPAAPAFTPPMPASPASAFTQSTYFEHRPTPTVKATPAETHAASDPLPSHATELPTTAQPEVKDWRHGALDRFKKMPDPTRSRYSSGGR